jgi:colicin import membrane protein
MELRWGPMLVISVIFHVVVFSVFAFVPGSIPNRTIDGVVYEVNLVEMPSAGEKSPRRVSPVEEKKGKTLVKKDTRARRISTPKKEAKPLVIAKRTVEKKTPTRKKPEVSPSKLIDQAISKIERKVEAQEKTESEDKSHIDRAISKLESKVDRGGGPGGRGGLPLSGIPMRIYQLEVESWIKSNWSYPVALQSQKDLEAIVLVMVKRDGSVTKTEIMKRSRDSVFDQSVIKAIERSNPLPPFPEGYRKSYEEFEINFNLKDLEGN